MTNLEAIKSTVAGYPLSDNTFIKALLDRGLSATAEYSGKSEQFDLSTADVYMVLASSANVSEGGYSVSVSEKANLLKMANAIYQKWNDSAATRPGISDASNLW